MTPTAMDASRALAVGWRAKLLDYMGFNIKGLSFRIFVSAIQVLKYADLIKSVRRSKGRIKTFRLQVARFSSFK